MKEKEDERSCAVIIQFAILPRIRNCDKLKRGEVIETIASTVGRHHRVDLQDPELMIIAEICKVRKIYQVGLL